MAESKWEKTLAALKQPTSGTAQTPTVLLPVKEPIRLGKRSTPGWKQNAVLLWHIAHKDSDARCQQVLENLRSA